VGSIAVTLVLALFLVVLAVKTAPRLWDWFGRQTLFTIEAVTIEGIQYLDEGHLRAQLPEISGKNLFRIDLEALKSEVVKHPWIADVKLHRRLPDELVIEVRERVPVAVINGQKLWVVDRGGVLMPLEVWHGVLDLPLVDYPLPDQAHPGQVLSGGDIQQALGYLDRIRERLPELWEMVSEVTWDRKDQLIFYTSRTRTRILVGPEPRWEQILNFYSFLIYEGGRAEMDDVASVDLRFPGQVIVKRNEG
jgi:cell division protein FtsQ